MNKSEAASVAMGKSVVTVIEEEEIKTGSDISSISPLLVPAKNILVRIIRDIDHEEEVLTTTTTSATAAKNAAEEDLIDDVLEIAGGIYSYATSVKDVALAEAYDLVDRNFTRLKEVDVPVKLDSIIKKAESLGELLVNHGVSAQEISDARTKYTLLTTKKSSQSSSISGKSGARKNLDLLLDEFDEQIKVLDKAMLKFRKRKPSFYNKYDSARVIKNLPTGSRVPQETGTGEPVPHQ